jgi:hypothetical protein
MSECRARNNRVNNGVASIIIAAWESEFDRRKLNSETEPTDRSAATTN